VPLTITRAQCDAIYKIMIPHLTAIGDVWLCVKRREFAEAKKMGREFAESCGSWRTSAGRRPSTATPSR